MGKCLNYFKSYKVSNEGIEYLEGDSVGLCYDTVRMIQTLLENFNVTIPIYNWCEYTDSESLELADPVELITGIDLSLKLLEDNDNPCLFGGLLFDDWSSSNSSNLIDKLKSIRSLSKEGFYFTFDSD